MGPILLQKLVFSQNFAYDWPELVLKPYHLTLCIRKDATQPVSVIFENSTSLRALQSFIFGANFTKKLVFFFQNIAHDWPEIVLKPYQLTLCIRTDPTRPVFVIFGNSTSLRALQPFIFGVNFTEKLVFSQNIAHDWPELVLKPYHMTLCIR